MFFPLFGPGKLQNAMISQADFHVAVGMQRKRFSEEAANAALYEELRNGRMLKQEWQHVRERAAAFEAKQSRGSRTVPGLGKVVNVIPAHEFFLLVNKYGHEEVGSKEFARSLQKHEPQLAVHKV